MIKLIWQLLHISQKIWTFPASHFVFDLLMFETGDFVRETQFVRNNQVHFQARSTSNCGENWWSNIVLLYHHDNLI